MDQKGKASRYAKVMSEMWHALEPSKKEKYYQIYRSEMVVYKELLDEYNKSITDDDRRVINEARHEIRSEIENRKYIRVQRKKARALNRPVKPVPPYLRFMQANADRQPTELYVDYLRRKAAEWKQLDDAQKEVYNKQSKDEMETYK